MRISEIFYSIQGEGALTGVPSVFVRTSGCNLRCSWCDTPYASWNPEGDEMSVDEILKSVGEYPARHVVLTGGEPMVAKGIHELAARLKEKGFHITIETAGTVSPGKIPCDLASLSPKLKNSTPSEGEISSAWIEKHEKRRIQPEVLDLWMLEYDYQLKFVVSEQGDLDEVDELINSRLEVAPPPWRIQLMPEGIDTESLRSRRDWILELCKERGFRYCQRLQIELFGDTRGT